MAQEIPLEASEVLDFTPPSFEPLGKAAPRFTLRTWTSREKREERRLQNRLGMTFWGTESLREEVRSGLKRLWTPEHVEEYLPLIEAYWEAQDDFDLQRKDNSDLKWEYDRDLEERIIEVLDRVGKAHDPLLEMRADNADFMAMLPTLWLAIGVESWTGLKTPMVRKAGYLTVECVEKMLLEVNALAKTCGAVDLAVTQLIGEVVKRKRLEEEEAGNFASPSPSETTQAASTPTSTSEADGTSPASASSSKTPETA